MQPTIEIDTLNGVISSTSNALAEAMAELIASEYRADEQDLMAAVGFDFDLGGSSSDINAA